MICLSYISTEEITDLIYTKMLSHFWLELNTYKNAVVEQEVYCFNVQIQ